MSSTVARCLSALGLVALHASCAAQRPGELTAEEVLHGARVACELEGSRARPLVVDMPATERAMLEATMKSGLAVVSYDCEQLRILPGCRVEGSYAYVGVTTKEEQIQLVDLDEVQANLPFGGVDVDVSAGRTVDIAMMLVGQLTTPLASVSEGRLVGDCDGATHFVRGATVGAFAMTQGTSAEHQAAVKLLLEEGADTSVPNYLGLTGRDLARAMNDQHPADGQRAELRELLRRWSMENPGHQLAIERVRNRSRPVQAMPVERPELDYIRCGFWQQHEPGGQLTYW